MSSSESLLVQVANLDQAAKVNGDHVTSLGACLREVIQAMRDYAMDTDDIPPQAHREMIERAEHALKMADIGPVQIASFKEEQGGMSVQLQGGPMHLFADMFVDHFRETGATNFLTMTFTHKESREEYTVTMQRANGITPAEKMAALQAQIEGSRHVGLSPQQESKYTTNAAGKIINRGTGEAIPDDEPVFIFRAKDRVAMAAITTYLNILLPGGHRGAVAARLADFDEFASRHPDRMKDPDTRAPRSIEQN